MIIKYFNIILIQDCFWIFQNLIKVYDMFIKLNIKNTIYLMFMIMKSRSCICKIINPPQVKTFVIIVMCKPSRIKKIGFQAQL